MGKLISVIIPCYNVEEYIDRCLNSIIHQTIGVEKLEVILVDDASTDNTWEKLLTWEKSYPESIILIQHETNKKQGAARNTGLYYVTAPYVSFVDADDWIALELFEKLFKKAIENDFDMVGSKFRKIDVDQEEVMKQFYDYSREGLLYEFTSKDSIRSLIVDGFPGYVWGKIIKTDIINDHQLFFLENCYYEDVDWKDRAGFCIRNYYEFEEPMYNYFMNPTSTTRLPLCNRHFDRFTIALNRIERYRQQNLYETYKNEIEIHFLNFFYANSLLLFLVRCTDFTVDIMNYMNQTVTELFPEYMSNPYLKLEAYSVTRKLLELVPMNLTSKEIDNLRIQLKNGIK